MAKTKTKNLRDQANDLAGKLAPHVETARAKAGPVVADARDKAAPVIADARDRFTHEVLPVLTAAVAAASEATEDVREDAAKRGKAAVAALKGQVDPPKQKHRVRKLLMVLGLGGVVAFVAKKMSDREPTTAWQSSYTPPPAPAAGTTTTMPGTPEADDSGIGAHRADETADDVGGASPDVAVADAAAEPHVATSPDNPVEEIDLTKE
jgi:vacuolar-type H+-ATPase subunit H